MPKFHPRYCICEWHNKFLNLAELDISKTFRLIKATSLSCTNKMHYYSTYILRDKFRNTLVKIHINIANKSVQMNRLFH